MPSGGTVCGSRRVTHEVEVAAGERRKFGKLSGGLFGPKVKRLTADKDDVLAFRDLAQQRSPERFLVRLNAVGGQGEDSDFRARWDHRVAALKFFASNGAAAKHRLVTLARFAAVFRDRLVIQASDLRLKRNPGPCGLGRSDLAALMLRHNVFDRDSGRPAWQSDMAGRGA